jgi:hypothetical protein
MSDSPQPYTFYIGRCVVVLRKRLETPERITKTSTINLAIPGFLL